MTGATLPIGTGWAAGVSPRIIPVGERYERLVVTSQRNPGEKRVQCRCDCGKDHSVSLSEWGKTMSCGCLRSERSSELKRTHGLSKSVEYRAWNKMRERCGDPRDRFWADYGGRGIAVCDRWADFMAFYEDMGPRPTPTHSIDRINNDRGYGPDNCRWATPQEQANNRRSRRLKTVCSNGHEYTPENTREYRKQRYCRACHRNNERKRRENKGGIA